MKLPNAEHAVVELAKLRDYCLSREHPRGRHKARVFASALGIRAEDAETLRQAILEAAKTEDASPTGADEHGQRFVVDFGMQGTAGAARVRTSWIMRRDEDFPRLTSCYVL